MTLNWRLTRFLQTAIFLSDNETAVNVQTLAAYKNSPVDTIGMNVALRSHASDQRFTSVSLIPLPQISRAAASAVLQD